MITEAELILQDLPLESVEQSASLILSQYNS